MSDHDELASRQRERWDALRARWHVHDGPPGDCSCDEQDRADGYDPMGAYPSVSEEP